MSPETRATFPKYEDSLYKFQSRTRCRGMNALLRLFGLELRTIEGPDQVARALCNSLTAYPGVPTPTPVVITHAQCINGNGLVRIFTSDGKQYTAQIEAVEG